VILLRVLGLVLLVCIALSGLSVLRWPSAVSAALIGVLLAVWKLRRREPEEPEPWTPRPRKRESAEH
jgi:hypothetical protein